MKKILISFLLLFLSFNSFAQEKIKKDIVPWGTQKSIELLNKSNFKNDFYQLANFYQPQINPFFCGVASSVIILNAINYNNIESQKEIEFKNEKILGTKVLEYKAYSQFNFLNDKTDKIKNRDIVELKKPFEIKNGKEIYDPGFTLSQLESILKNVHNLKVKKVYAKNNKEKSIENFRKDLKKYLIDNSHFIIVNIDGSYLFENAGGHLSPVVAYDEKSDYVMVMDVAIHKRPWYFVKTQDLFQAMNSLDGSNYRGYLIISK